MSAPAPHRDPRPTIAAGLCASLVAWATLRPWAADGWMIGAPLGHDFVNFWLAPRLLAAGRGEALVDLPAYAEAVRAAFGLSHDPGLVYVYPPHAALLTGPFAALPFLPAVLAWTALNLAALYLAARLQGGPPGRAAGLAAALSPAAAAMAIYGHFGGLLAVAAGAALAESRRRPWLAGLCLAGLSVKPQLAGALGLILICAGRWRWLPAAALATAALVALSAAAFGVEAWWRFIAVTVPMQGAFITEFRAPLIHASVSPYFSARLWGLPAGAAWAIQGLVGALALALGARAVARAPDGPERCLVVLLAALVMQPYVAHYDLAVAAPAMTLVVLARAPAPLVLAAWLLVPLARVFYYLDMPILGLIVPGALFAQGVRLLAPPRAAGPAPRLSPATA